MWFSRDQAPERAFPAMFGFKPLHVGLMRLEAAEILNLIGQVLALVQMTGRMLVALDPVLLQGEVNQGPAQNGRGQRLLGF